MCKHEFDRNRERNENNTDSGRMCGGRRFHGRGPGHGPMHRPFMDPDSLTGLFLRVNRSMMRFPYEMRGSRRVLKLLSLADGTMTQGELMHLLEIQPGSLSELLKKMEAQELLTRVRDEEDHRKVVITLTEKGKEAVNEPHVRRDPYAALSEDEKDTLKALLKKLAESWETANEN